MSDRIRPDTPANDNLDEAIVIDCDLDQPPAQVWKALTVPNLLAAWLMPNDIEPEPGHRFAFRGDRDGGGTVDCEVLAAEPHRLLRYSWRRDETDIAGEKLDTTVTFVLTATPAGGTHLRVVHEGFVRAPRMLAAGARVVSLRPPVRLRPAIMGDLRRAA